MSRATITHGDCLEHLAKIPAGSFGIAVTDPPYSINTRSDGTGKLNPFADAVNAARFYTETLLGIRQALRPDGAAWVFTSWRTLFTLQKASWDAGWPIESLLVWDKQWIGPGGQRGLRPRYELVALFANENFAIPDRGIPDILPVKWTSKKPTGHPAEKPVDLLRWIIRTSDVAGPVLDPFCGSGSTAVAALAEGRDFLGFELDPRWHKFAERRVAEDGTQREMAL